MGSQPIKIQLRKILWENLVGKSCRKMLWDREEGEKANLRKAVIGGICSIWNRVMERQPIRIQLRKILRENLAGKSCGKILWEIPVGTAVDNLVLNLVGNIAEKV